MDKNLEEYLKKHEIVYKTHEHQAVFTVDEHHKLQIKTPGVLHTKNLFLKDENKRFFLVCMYANKRLNLKLLKEKLNGKNKLTFGSTEELKEHLNSTPGSVSLFGMIYAREVILIIDKQVWDAKKVGFHPNINTATLELTHENLEKFCNSIKSEKHILKLE